MNQKPVNVETKKKHLSQVGRKKWIQACLRYKEQQPKKHLSYASVTLRVGLTAGRM